MGGAFEQQQHERNPNGRNQHNVWGQNNVNQLVINVVEAHE